MADGLRVAEVFGPTFQGEGPSTGRRAYFVRLSGCNLDCSWCDTPYTWDWRGKNGTAYDPAAEARRMTTTGVLDALAALGFGGTDLLVVTGGEPMLQASRLADLFDEVPWMNPIEVETNGTVSPHGFRRRVRFNVSPKLASSGVDASAAFVESLRAYGALARDGGAAFKFVVCEPADVDEIDEVRRRYAIPAGAVWLMPEGRDAATVAARLAAIAPVALERGYNLSGRLHVTLWGDERGR